MRQGLRFLRQQLPQIMATRTDVLSPRMVRIIGELITDWEYLDERIERVTDEVEALARTHPAALPMRSEWQNLPALPITGRLNGDVT